MSSVTDPPGASWLPHGDKLGHIALYAVLGAALSWGRFASGSRAPHALLVLLGCLIGVSDEWHQSSVPGRQASLGDVAADAVGVLAGYSAALLLLTRRGERALFARTTPPDQD